MIKLLWLIAVYLPLVGAQEPTFEQFLDRDLWKQKPSANDRRILDRLIGETPQHWFGGLRYLWKPKISGPARYLAMLAKPLIVIPGGSSACVRLFDSAGRNIGNWVFPTGWRIDVASASLEYSALLKRQLLVMRMVRFSNGRNIAKEYYDFHGDQLRLVRLENDEGELAQSEYVSKTYEIGPVLEAISAQEWLGLLRSADPGAVLAALTFLGGRHLDGPDRLFGPGGHEGQYAPLFLRLLESAEIRGAIEELHGSKNLWIREVALTASRGRGSGCGSGSKGDGELTQPTG